MNDVQGVVFPLPSELIERFLRKEKDVLVKFGKFLYLARGQRVVFYDSDLHAEVGEATIEEVNHESPAKVWKTYGQRLMLNKGEFEEYTIRTPLGPRSRRKAAIMTVCILTKPVRYKKAVKPAKKMTMLGHYLR